MRTVTMPATLILLLALAAPALAETVNREAVLEPGGRFVLEADVGRVDLRGVARSGARIVVSSERPLAERFDLDVREGDGEVVVSLQKLGSWSWFGRDRSSLSFSIEVPRETGVTLSTGGGSIEVREIVGSLSARTSGGSIELREIEGAVEARTSGGSVEVREIAGATNLATSGGSIRARDVDGTLVVKTSGGTIGVTGVTGDLQAKTSGGSIRILEAGGRVEARTSGGSISVRFAEGNDAGGELRTSAGGIQIELDPTVGLAVDLQTSVGTARSEIPVSGSSGRGKLSGTINRGGARLVAKTSAGSIVIDER